MIYPMAWFIMGGQVGECPEKPRRLMATIVTISGGAIDGLQAMAAGIDPAAGAPARPAAAADPGGERPPAA